MPISLDPAFVKALTDHKGTIPDPQVYGPYNRSTLNIYSNPPLSSVVLDPAFIKALTDHKGTLPDSQVNPIHDVSVYGSNIQSYESQYDLRDQLKVSPVKNQSYWPTCWAHAALASLESTSLPSEDFDFSEKNLVNCANFSLPVPGGGGNDKMAAAYLTRWGGPIDEQTDPYPTGSTWDRNSISSNPVKHVQDVIYFPGRTNGENFDIIKDVLKNFGAVSSSIFWDDSNYNSSSFSYYQPLNQNETVLTDGYRHSMTIIGWDDNYPAQNFTIIPPGNGAWIVKNSEGISWGDQGYLRVSYYDKHFGSSIPLDDSGNLTSATYLGESPSNYQNIYQYDPLGFTVANSISDENNSSYYANIFTASSNCVITGVGFYSVDVNIPYEINIYKNPLNSPINGTLASTYNGTEKYMGYHTVPITPNSNNTFRSGELFSVVIKVYHRSNNADIPIEWPIPNYSERATGGVGQSYFSNDGINWADLNQPIITNSNVCLKAYTSTPLTITSIIPNTGENTGPVTITNLSGTNFVSNTNVFLSRNSLPIINATNISVLSSTTITCTLNITDAEPGAWNATVQNPDGQSDTLENVFAISPYSCRISPHSTYYKNGILYTYPDCPPIISSVSPTTGVNTGSVSITNLSGENFNTSATVNLTRTGQPNITATNVQVVSSSQITCTLPLTGKAAGQWNIIVTNPDGQSGILANGFTVTAANPGNTPFVIDPSAMNTFDGQYLKSRGYGWCDFGGVNNSYYKITLAGTTQYPTEFHLKKSFTTKAQFGILVQASNVRISGVDLSTAPNADQRPVNSITNTYAPLTLAETGAAGIKVTSGFTGVKLVDVNVVGQNVPAVHVDGSNLDIIGTNNPDPYLTTYSGSGINDNWGTTLTGKLNSGYGLGLLQQTTSRSSAVTITGDGGAGVNISGPFSGIELNGKTATLAISGNTIRINGTGTDSGTGSDRNSGISAWGGSRVNVTATDSSITGQEYGIYGQGGAIINVSCPGCTLGPIVSSTAGRPYREQVRSAGKSGIVGGVNGIFLTGTSSAGYGTVSIANTTVQGNTGYGINLSQASGYSITVTNPASVIGALGKFGTTDSSSNQITSGNSVITATGTGPYPVHISLDSIQGPDPFNLKIFNESGSVVYDITNWNLLPTGVTFNSTDRNVWFNSSTLEIYSAEKYAHAESTLTVTGIEPSAGYCGKTTRIENLSGTFNLQATNTSVIITRSGVTIPVTGVSIETAGKITGNLSVPSDAQTGPWQVAVFQDGKVSEGNVTFTLSREVSAPTVTTLQAENVSTRSALLAGNLTGTGGENCLVFFRYGKTQENLSAYTSPVTLNETGNFSTLVTGLDPGTTWYYQASANNSAGAGQGGIVTFRTDSVFTNPVVYTIQPSSGTQGEDIAITNLSGIFNTSAQTTGIYLSRSGTNISASDVTIRSADSITGNFSLPPLVQTGSWQIIVQQDGWLSSENVTFTINPATYTINASASAGGTISPAGVIQVLAGSNQTCSINPGQGYHTSGVFIDNTSAGVLNTYTFANVTSNHTIHAEFAVNGAVNYTINATSSSGGTISPSGLIPVLAGSNLTCTMNPDQGYRISDVFVDNASMGQIATYTFTNISSQHQIRAEYTQTLSSPVVLGVTPSSAPRNSVATLIITGENFYGNEQVDLVRNGTGNLTRIATRSGNNLQVTGLDLTNAQVGSYDIWVTNLTTRMSGWKKDAFSVTTNDQRFYTITTRSDQYGFITPPGPFRVRPGSQATFAMHTIMGADIENVTVDGVPVVLGAHNDYTFKTISADHTLYLHTKFSEKKVHADFTVNQTTGKTPMTAQFTDTSTGSPSQWVWLFGDAKTSTLQNPAHTYNLPGKYSVRLTVRNSRSIDTIEKNRIISVTRGRYTGFETDNNETIE
ncbi:lectin like domain-containing protein [Methanospirillum lacunae]|nr:lectin like domain-containing protein [Methanospirillum lacunae]